MLALRQQCQIDAMEDMIRPDVGVDPVESKEWLDTGIASCSLCGLSRCDAEIGLLYDR
jgi:hypothetical protein